VDELPLEVGTDEHLVDPAQDFGLETGHPPPLDRRVEPPDRVEAGVGEALVHPRQEVVRVEDGPDALAILPEMGLVLRRVEVVPVDRADAALPDAAADLLEERTREVLAHRIRVAREERLRGEPRHGPPAAARAAGPDLDSEALDGLPVRLRRGVEGEQGDRELRGQAREDVRGSDLPAIVDRVGELLRDEEDPSGGRHVRSPSRTCGSGPRRPIG